MEGVNIFDILIALSGAYLIYEAMRMKKSGKITGGVIVSKDVEVDKIKDRDGFIRYMFRKTLMLGILAVIIGSLGIISGKLEGFGYIPLIGVIVYLLALILFAVASVKARKMFIE